MGISFFISHLIFLRDITIVNSNGWIFWIERSTVTLEKNNLFLINKGGIKVLKGSRLTFDENSKTTFRKNICEPTNRDSVYDTACQSICHVVINSKLVVRENAQIQFFDNIATFNGGISLTQSNMSILSNATLIFQNNEGSYGGALSMYAGSQIELCTSKSTSSTCNSSVITAAFRNNHAGVFGGAVYVEDSSYVDILYEKLLKKSIINRCGCEQAANISFINNTATIAGSDIYGGWFDLKLCEEPDFPIKYNFHIHKNESDPSQVSSDPVRVCLCVEGRQDCSISEHTVQVYPGQLFEIQAVAVGQRFGTVPAVIFATTNESFLTIIEDHEVQIVRKNCTSLHYSLSSTTSESNGSFKLSTKRYSKPTKDIKEYNLSLLQQLSIAVHLQKCPIGFTKQFNVVLKMYECRCHQSFQKYRITNCNITTQEISKPRDLWMNATFTHTINNTTGILIHRHCPFDYCRYPPPTHSSCQLETKFLRINLNDPDEQCAFNHSGILCGACRNNFSRVLGTSKCKRCSSLWILLIFPTAALAGITLVVFLISLNMTVSIGAINGLIFYANIVRANHAIFFPPSISNSFLSTFIAWVNLDLGIEVCLYDGLDAYATTWLQFLFPTYIWVIVVTIIVTSYYSSTVARLSGSNVVSVLVTLFLLSYAKLLRLFITVFQSTVLVYPDGYWRRVWLYDGNVDYLKGKHILLFIAALLLLVVLSIPYTASLIFIQCLRRVNHLKILFWVRKLKPLFDAHTGPYKDKHGYWTGLLLFIRVVLLVVFSLNMSGDASTNLLAICISIISLLSYITTIGGVYKSFLINTIEVSFFMNTGILTVATYFFRETPTPGVTNASTGIAFSSFVLIALYHIYLKFITTRRGTIVKRSLKMKLRKPMKKDKQELNSIFIESTMSHSSIELREELLKEDKES